MVHVRQRTELEARGEIMIPKLGEHHQGETGKTITGVNTLMSGTHNPDESGRHLVVKSTSVYRHAILMYYMVTSIDYLLPTLEKSLQFERSYCQDHLMQPRGALYEQNLSR